MNNIAFSVNNSNNFCCAFNNFQFAAVVCINNEIRSFSFEFADLNIFGNLNNINSSVILENIFAAGVNISICARAEWNSIVAAAALN